MSAGNVTVVGYNMPSLPRLLFAAFAFLRLAAGSHSQSPFRAYVAMNAWSASRTFVSELLAFPADERGRATTRRGCRDSYSGGYSARF